MVRFRRSSLTISETVTDLRAKEHRDSLPGHTLIVSVLYSSKVLAQLTSWSVLFPWKRKAIVLDQKTNDLQQLPHLPATPTILSGMTWILSGRN